MKPVNKFFVQYRESSSSYTKQIFSFLLKMHCKRILISTTGSQAAGRKQPWPRHGKLEQAKKLHDTIAKKKKLYPKLWNVNSFTGGMHAYISHVFIYSSAPKVNMVNMSLQRGMLCHFWWKRQAQNVIFLYDWGDQHINKKIYHFKTITETGV